MRDVGGISSSILNGRLFKVSNSGLDFYNITAPTPAGSSVLGGGSNVIASYNRKYERLYAQIPHLELEGTTIDSFVSTTNIVPVDASVTNYNSYSITDYEQTFLNEEHFFINQKVVTSDINSVINGISNSLKYKLRLKTTNSAVSPIIDLRTASVKTASNRVENATGYENRYGKRNQILTFLSLFDITLSVSGTNADELQANTVVIGQNSKAEGFVVSFENGTARIRLRTQTEFKASESLTLVNSQGEIVDNVAIQVGNISRISFDFSVGSNLIAYYPFDTDIDYNNKINGKIVLWDPEENVLVVENSFTPINNNYTSSNTEDTAFVRLSSSTNQQPDIFRAGDVIKTTTGTEVFLEIASMSFDTGIDYVPETDSSNSSSVAKYVTKEIAINTPGTSVTVKSTVNILNIKNIKFYYKIKEASSSINFKDTNWIPFNNDGNPDFEVIATPTNSISGQFEKQEDYQELTYSASNLPEFSSFAIKIIMRSENPAYVPKVQDIRAVASY